MFKRKYPLYEEAGEGSDGSTGDSGGDSGPTLESLQAQIDSLNTEKTALLNRNNELLAETKKNKEQRRQAEADAAKKAREKAEAENDYKQLYESSENERNALQSQLDSMNNKIANDKTKSEAMKIAIELADGANAEILSDYISRRLKFTDDGIKVTDESGNLTVSSLDDLKKEFAGSARFSSLIKGKQSSGGGASGGAKGGSAAEKNISRAEFDAMSHYERGKFAKSGGKVTE